MGMKVFSNGDAGYLDALRAALATAVKVEASTDIVFDGEGHQGVWAGTTFYDAAGIDVAHIGEHSMSVYVPDEPAPAPKAEPRYVPSSGIIENEKGDWLTSNMDGSISVCIDGGNEVKFLTTTTFLMCKQVKE